MPFSDPVGRNPVGDTATGRDGLETRVVIRGRDGGGGDDDPPDVPDPKDDDPTVSIAPRPRRRTPASRTLTVGASGQIVPIVYGQAQVGSIVPYAHAIGNDCYIQYVVAEGPIEAIEELGFGDSPATSFNALGLINGTDYELFLGEPTQNVSTLLAATKPTGEWKWRFPRLAYVALKFNITRTGFENVDPRSFRCVVKGRLVNDYRIDGTMDFADRAYTDNAALCTHDFFREQLFGVGAEDDEIDPTTFGDEAADDCDVQIAAFTGDTPTTAPTVAMIGGGNIERGSYRWGYTRIDAGGVESLISSASSTSVVGSGSTNRAAMVSGLTNGGTGTMSRKRVYRQKLGFDGVTWGPWKRVKDFDAAISVIYDGFATSSLGGPPPLTDTIKQFKMALRVADEESVGDTVNLMRGTFTAAVVYNNGKYQCYVDKARTATSILYSAADIVDIPTVRGRDPSEAPSQIVVHFVNQALNYKPDEASWPAQLAVAAGGRSDRIVEDHSYESIPTYDQALRVAKWLWNRAQSGFTIDWTTTQKGALPLPMSRIEVAHGRMGLAATPVVVSSCGPSSRDTWALKGELEITPDTDYHADPGSDTTTTDPPPPGDPPDPSDNFVLIVGMSLPFEAYNVPEDPPE